MYLVAVASGNTHFEANIDSKTSSAIHNDKWSDFLNFTVAINILMTLGL